MRFFVGNCTERRLFICVCVHVNTFIHAHTPVYTHTHTYMQGVSGASQRRYVRYMEEAFGAGGYKDARLVLRKVVMHTCPAMDPDGMYVCMYVYIYVCVCVCVYVHICLCL